MQSDIAHGPLRTIEMPDGSVHEPDDSWGVDDARASSAGMFTLDVAGVCALLVWAVLGHAWLRLGPHSRHCRWRHSCVAPVGRPLEQTSVVYLATAPHSQQKTIENLEPISYGSKEGKVASFTAFLS